MLHPQPELPQIHLQCVRELAERFRNGDMCRLTEQVIFTDPYYDAPVNKHSSPKLDSLVHALRTDTEAKVVVSGLKVCTMTLVEYTYMQLSIENLMHNISVRVAVFDEKLCIVTCIIYMLHTHT